MAQKQELKSDGPIKLRESPGFTMISNAVICDVSLSGRAKGYYTMIRYYVSIPGFVLYKSHLFTQVSDGMYAFNSGWRELKEHGYLKQYRRRVPGGFQYEYELLNEADLSTPAEINIRMDGSMVQPGESDKEAPKSPLEKLREEIEGQIDYAHYQDLSLSDDERWGIIRTIRNVMLEVLTCKGPSIRIGGEDKDTAEVQDTFWKLDYRIVDTLIYDLWDVDWQEVKSKSAYVKTAIYRLVKDMADDTYFNSG